MHEFFGSIDKRKDQALGTMQLLSNYTIILIILFSAYLFTYLPKLNLKYLKYSLHNIHKVQVLLNIAMYVCDCALCLSFYADVFKTPLKNAKGMYFSTNCSWKIIKL